MVRCASEALVKGPHTVLLHATLLLQMPLHTNVNVLLYLLYVILFSFVFFTIFLFHCLFLLFIILF